MPYSIAEWGFPAFFENLQRQKNRSFSHRMQWHLPKDRQGTEACCYPTAQSLREGGIRGLNWSGVDPPLSSSRACLTTFIAFSVP